MREPNEPARPLASHRPPRRLRVMAGVALAVLFFGLIIIWNGAGIYTDYLWFDSVDHTSVWSGILRTRILLAVTFTAAFFVVLLANLIMADRLAPRSLGGAEDEMLQRYQEMFSAASGKGRIAVSAAFALIAGAGVSSRWTEWMLFSNSVEVGTEDPLHGIDLGFYMFKLPFLSFVADWAFASLIIVLILTGIAHYLNGGIRVQQPMQRVTPQVKAHISVLLGALALVRAFDYWLQRYELTISQRGTVDGALYTDVETKLPAISLLTLISVFAFGLFIYNIRRKGWALPVVAISLWAFVAIVVGTVYPAVTQRFRVEPDESAREAPFINRNVAATRLGLGLDDIVDATAFASEAMPLSAETVEDEATLLDQLVLLDPSIMRANLQAEESKRQFYRFRDVDVDRYEIDGVETPVIISVRELDQDKLPGAVPGWEAQHITYTHGYGITVAPANAISSDGNPAPVVSDIPVQLSDGVRGDLITQPRVYFGEGLTGYSIVKTGRREENGSGDFTPYEGAGGVPMGSNLRQAAFALRFGDLNPLISRFVVDGSEILYVRDIRQRVQKVAPFLALDSDPYPVLIDGRISYVVDAYTTSARVPYSQRADVSDVPGTSGLRRRLNYVRNSVKAVVDGYDGSVTLYALDEGEDPIVDVWKKSFPDLFSPFDEMPAELQEHLRYPTDLFRIQTNMWGRYQLDDPQEFYDLAQAWTVAQDPGATQSSDSGGGEGAPARRVARIDPSYHMFRLPDEEQPGFSLVRSFVPAAGQSDDSSDNKLLTGMMVGRTSARPGEYNTLHVVPTPRLPSGPAIVQARLTQDAEIASELSLLDATGSEVRFGDMLIFPLEESILYIRPVFGITSSDAKVPQLEQVMMSDGQNEVMEPTVTRALQALVRANGAQTEDRDDPDSPEPERPDPPNRAGSASEALANAQDALSELEDEIAELEQRLQELEASAGGSDADESGVDTESVEDDEQAEAAENDN